MMHAQAKMRRTLLPLKESNFSIPSKCTICNTQTK